MHISFSLPHDVNYYHTCTYSCHELEKTHSHLIPNVYCIVLYYTQYSSVLYSICTCIIHILVVSTAFLYDYTILNMHVHLKL